MKKIGSSRCVSVSSPALNGHCLAISAPVTNKTTAMVTSKEEDRKHRKNSTFNRRKYALGKIDRVFGLEHDEIGMLAPFILPDCHKRSRSSAIYRWELTRKSYIAAKAKWRRKFGLKKRCYIQGHLYYNTKASDEYTIDCSKLTSCVVSVNVTTLGADGLVNKPPHKKKNQYVIRAGRVCDLSLLSLIVSFGLALFRRLRNGNARTNGAYSGSMTVFGDHMYRGKRVPYKSIDEGKRDTPQSMKLLAHIKHLSKLSATSLATWMRTNSSKCWRGLLERLRKAERDKGIIPSPIMGGLSGITSSGVISTDLGNEAHFDVLDDGESVSVWVEVLPGSANNWYLCFPNMEIISNGKVYHGLRIRLCHGAIVNWDGRVMKHFTSVTDVGKDNHVFGYFFCPSTRLH